MACDPKSNQSEFQPFPTEGKLFNNLNRFKHELELDYLPASGEDMVYYYIPTSIVTSMNDKWEYKWEQTGAGPNFQGDLITLSICKHKMRESHELKELAKKSKLWIAGISTKETGNYLFYLMKVKKAYPSHAALWRDLGVTVRDAKRADKNQLGDLYVPKSESLSGDAMLDPDKYVCPIKEHWHQRYPFYDGWKDDIIKSQQAPLLVGDPEHSYLWSKRKLSIPNPLNGKILRRGHCKTTLNIFIKNLIQI